MTLHKILSAFYRPGKGYCEMTTGDICNRAKITHDEAYTAMWRASCQRPPLAKATSKPTSGTPTIWAITPEGIAIATTHNAQVTE